MAKVILKEYLNERGIKAKWLIDKTGITQATISNLMNNKTDGVKFDTLQKICTTLKCDINEIIEIEKE